MDSKTKRRITPLLVSPSFTAAAPAGVVQRSAAPSMSVKDMAEYTERNIGPGRRLYVALQEPGATVSWSKVGRGLGALQCLISREQLRLQFKPHTMAALTTQAPVQLVEEQQKRLITSNGEDGVQVTWQQLVLPVAKGAAVA